MVPTYLKPLIGVNLAGGEFGGNKMPGRMGWDYVYPSIEQIDWYAAMGMRLVRIPFLSGRLTRADRPYMPDVDALMAAVARAGRHGMVALLDMHEYAKRPDGTPVTTDPADLARFRQAWRVVAAEFAGLSNVWLGLMNEPNKQTAKDWIAIAKAGLAGIREVAPMMPVTVMGSHWGTADDFPKLNGAAFQTIDDPYVIVEVHQYFDGKGGKPLDGHRAIRGLGASSLVDVTDWARQAGRKLFLGEFAFTADPGDMREGRDCLAYLASNADAWIGAAYWAGGLWWAKGRRNPPYPFSIEPRDFSTFEHEPQLELLREFA